MDGTRRTGETEAPGPFVGERLAWGLGFRLERVVPEPGLEPGLPEGWGILGKQKTRRQIGVFLICWPFSF